MPQPLVIPGKPLIEAEKLAEQLAAWDKKQPLDLFFSGYVYVITPKYGDNNFLYSVTVRSYRVASDDPDKETRESARFRDQNDRIGGTDKLDEAEVEAEFAFKWDGCSDLLLGDGEGWTHFCCDEQIMRFLWALMSSKVIAQTIFERASANPA